MVVVALPVLAASGLAEAQEALSSQQLREALSAATEPPIGPEKPVTPGTRAADLVRSVEYDLVRRKERILPIEPPSLPRQGATSVPSFIPAGATAADDVSEDAPHQRATFPTIVTATREFPYRTVVKLLMRFRIAGGTRDFVCSAATTDGFHLLTAGHCIYSHDPNQDNNTSDAQWAEAIWAFPAQTDVAPAGIPDWPFGYAKAVYMRSYTGWTQFANVGHDWGVITLDRRIGDRTGWMGREAGVTTSALNFSGYPTETPYVPPLSQVQYRGFEAVVGYGETRIGMDALTFGGHSGGPVWRYADDRYIQGVNSTSNRGGYAEATRLTLDKFANLNSYIVEDEASRAPVARPFAIEYVLGGVTKDVSPAAVHAGSQIRLTYNVVNVGFVAAPSVDVKFFLSADPRIDTSNIYKYTPFFYFIGSAQLSDLGPNTYANPTAVLTVPHGVPQGSYYAGWIMSAAGGYPDPPMSAVIGDQQVIVSAAPSQSKCTYSFSVSSVKIDPTVTVGNLSVSTQPACAWSLASDSPWLAPVDEAGVGPSAVEFVALRNDTGAARSGNLRLSGQNGGAKRFRVKQAKCTFALGAKSHLVASGGGQGSVIVNTQDDCEWGAVSSVPWLRPTTPNGHSTSSLQYEVDPLPPELSRRTASIALQGKKLRIIQKR